MTLIQPLNPLFYDVKKQLICMHPQIQSCVLISIRQMGGEGGVHWTLWGTGSLLWVGQVMPCQQNPNRTSVVQTGDERVVSLLSDDLRPCSLSHLKSNFKSNQNYLEPKITNIVSPRGLYNPHSCDTLCPWTPKPSQGSSKTLWGQPKGTLGQARHRPHIYGEHRH